jgi:hypothetical protein
MKIVWWVKSDYTKIRGIATWGFNLLLYEPFVEIEFADAQTSVFGGH